MIAQTAGNFSVLSFLLALVILFVIFLLLRELICWYYKINTIVKQNEEQNNLLREIRDLLKNGGKNNNDINYK